MQENEELRLEIVQDERGFDALESEWRILFERCQSATTPLKWEWLREWWRIFGTVYGTPPGGLHLITVRAGKHLKAALPLYISAEAGCLSRTLRFISTGEARTEVTYPEYFDLLSDAAYAEKSIELISRHIFGTIARSWDRFDLGILSPGSCLHSLAKKPLRSIALLNRELRHSSSRVNLSAGFDGYLGAVSSSSRQNFRRLLRQASHPGFEFAVASTAPQIELFLSELMRLHQERWVQAGMPGAFGSPRIVKLHQVLTQQLTPKNEALLSRLSISGVPVALIYGFINKGKFDFYQSGIDAAHKDVKSPGILAHLLTMEYLSRYKVHTYDFLVGKDLYKERLATSTQSVSEISLMRPTLRSALSAARTAYRRVAGKLRKSVSP